MHELAIMADILKIVLDYAEKNDARRVISVKLKVGEMTDLEDTWMQRYFDHLTENTIAGGAKLNLERLPIVFTCKTCATPFAVEKNQWDRAVCIKCGSKDLLLTSGNSFYLDSIEVI
jgi:hydrogenase nickel incorporation protein HypA/HybF